MFALAPFIAAAALTAIPTTPLPDPGEYVTVRDGRLATAKGRVRLWCVIGGFPNYSGITAEDPEPVRAAKTARAYRDADALIARFELLGFNGMRLWEKPEGAYVKGDGSKSDVLDYFVARAKSRGFRIWVPAISVAPIRESDAELAGSSDTAGEFKTAVKENVGHTWIARVWDDRLEAAQVRRMTDLTGHVNQHTGLRWGDDPVFAIWELTNEEWWMMKMVGGQWQTLPAYFQASLRRKWGAYLQNKYKDEEGLKRAWGFLMPGESLNAGTVQIAPLADPIQQQTAGMDPQARLQVEAARAQGRSAWGRGDFTRARGADVLEFFVGLQLAHKHRLRSALKRMGRSAELGPTVFDTGIGYEIQSQFMHQQADAVAHDAYINGVTPNKSNQRYPWISGLEEWPRIAQDVPWLEHNRVEGKPYLCYETQIMQPAKYRSEFPMRLLALAAIQDWDAICWHYWGSVPHITTEPNPFDQPMDVTTGWHPQGYHYTYDAVQNALMKAASAAFRSGALRPAPKPTKFIYGRRSLYDPASMDYGGSYGKLGTRMLPTTYQHGVRIFIDPTVEEDRAEGPTADPLGMGLANRVQSTDQILFDVGRGGLVLDSPGAVGFTGFFRRFGAEWRFRSGASLSGVDITVPAEMPHAEGIAEEKYIGFLLAAQDGLPLASTKKAVLAIKSTSFNTGFRLLLREDSLAEGGTLPVLEARVSATIRSPHLAGMKAKMLDWHGRELPARTIGKDGVLKIPSDIPLWVVQLER